MNIVDWSRSRYQVSTNPLLAERRLELVVVVLVAVLLLQIILGLAFALLRSGPERLLPAADSLRVAELQLFDPLSDDQSAAIVTRPLFWESRRPLDTVVAASPAQNDKPKTVGELKGVKLVGVFGGGDSGGAIVLLKGQKQRVLVGQDVEGWRLDSVAADRAVFVNGAARDEKMLATATPGDLAPVQQQPAGARPAKAEPAQASGELTLGGMVSGK